MESTTYGHDAGDHVLRAVGQRLTDSIRVMDLAARMGGDEFLVVACGLNHVDEVPLIAGKLKNVVSQEVTYHGQAVKIGASIGTAIYPDDALAPEELISLADEAMYVAKRAGKSRAAAQTNGPAATPEAEKTA